MRQVSAASLPADRGMWMRRTTGAFIDARPARSGVGGGDRQARSAAHVQHSFAAHLPGRGSEAETPDALALQMQLPDYALRSLREAKRKMTLRLSSSTVER
jgi:hypothetical protein